MRSPSGGLQDPNVQVLAGAPQHCIESFFQRLEAEYGSVDQYLDSIGFSEQKRADFRRAFTE